ncbi:MAG: leucine-rich repeat protein [Saccharofermentans sp.]|nr:leucine-rich repeat protein [Saccharofermentans sp.]
MKRLKLLIACIMSIIAIAIIGNLPPFVTTSNAAEQQVIGELKYEFDESNHTAKVVGNRYTFSSITIPEKVTYNNVEYTVTEIGAFAFISCSNLTSVSIPSSVVKIGNSAFYECGALTTVNLPNDLKTIDLCAFVNCSSLESITIPSNITSIGYGAFINCTSLKALHIPAGVTVADGYDIFRGLSGLKEVTMPSYWTSIPEYAFEDCSSLESITIPSNITSIGNSAFADCTSLKTVTIEDGLTSISDATFTACTSLTSISIPGSVTSIGSAAFRACTSLTSISIPGSVTSIGDIAFYGCTNLFDITMAEGVTSIGSGAFFGTSISRIVIPNSVTSMGSDVFGNCGNLSEVKIGTGLTSIPASAFIYCTSLRSIVIPSNVKSIGDSAFANCTELSNVQFALGLESIGADAFSGDENYGCPNLQSVILPVSVTSIGSKAFYYTNVRQHNVHLNCKATVASDAFKSDYEGPYKRDMHDMTTATNDISNNHTGICANCGQTVVSPHVYDNACDATCNVCGYTRTDLHDYRVISAKEHRCSICGDTKKHTIYNADGSIDTMKESCSDCKDAHGFAVKNIAYEGLTITITNPTYDGTKKTPDISVIGLKKNKQYAVSVDDKADVSTTDYTVKITGVFNGSGVFTSYVGELTKTWNVEPSSPVIGTVSYSGGTLYDTTDLSEVVLTRSDASIPGELKLTASELTIGTASYEWKFVPTSLNYKEIIGSIQLTVVKDVLEGIAIKTNPAKMTYTHGDSFDKTGLVVTATFSSHSEDITASSVVVTGSTLNAGQTFIEISYTKDGITKKCDLTGLVVNKKIIDISGAYWNVGNYTYTGEPQGPSLEGLPAGVVVVTVTGDSATMANTYIASATLGLADGYNSSFYELSGTNPVTASWSIEKAEKPSNTPVDTLNYLVKNGKKLSDVELPAGWSWEDGTAVLPTAEETVTAKAVYTASDAGNYVTTEKTITITMTTCSHPTNKVSVITDKEATCVTAGLAHKYCASCDMDIESNIQIPAKGHAFTTKASEKIATDATCTKAATYYVKCDRCDAVDTVKTVVVGDPLGHKYAGWTYCDKEKHQRICANDDSHVETADHVFADNKCVDCGYEKKFEEYDMAQGADSSWEKGSKDGLVFGSAATSDKFVCVKVDGEMIDASNYKVESDPAKITLLDSYLESLSDGEHRIEIVYTDGSATSKFTVRTANEPVEPTESDVPNGPEKPTEPEEPTTGDNKQIIWVLVPVLVLVLGAGIAVAGISVYRKRTNK